MFTKAPGREKGNESWDEGTESSEGPESEMKKPNGTKLERETKEARGGRRKQATEPENTQEKRENLEKTGCVVCYKKSELRVQVYRGGAAVDRPVGGTGMGNGKEGTGRDDGGKEKQSGHEEARGKANTAKDQAAPQVENPRMTGDERGR